MARDSENQMALYKVTATVEIQVWAWDEDHAKKIAPESLTAGRDTEDWFYVETTAVEDTGRFQ